MSENLYGDIFKKTLLEFIDEISDILTSGRYEVPDIIKTDLKAAKITVSAAPMDVIMDIMNDFGKFVIQFEHQITKHDVNFFYKLDICKSCQPSGSATARTKGQRNKKEHCTCSPCCEKTCTCDAKCPNCSELLKNLDSKTFVTAKFIIEQAIQDTDADKQEDIDVIFNYISSLLAAAKNHKKR